MAAALKITNRQSSGGASPAKMNMMTDISVKEDMLSMHVAPNKIYLKPLKRSQGKCDREREIKRLILRAQQPMLTKPDTSEYRNTYLHNLCLDMLEKGFHRSFSELFALVKQQHTNRERAGPDSILWNQILLEDEHDKLDVLQQHLTAAESAEREEKYKDVYQSEYKLACYFKQTIDKWLSDHFFQQCLLTSSKVTDDDNRTLAEGHCNMGFAVEENGDNYTAAEHFEIYHELTTGHDDWITEDGSTLHDEACNYLVRIYTTIAYKVEQAQCLEYLLKAYMMAQEGGNKKLEAIASYRLGLAYEKASDAKTALVYLMRYFDMCKSLTDDDGLGLACEAIAQAYERQDKVNESIKYLEMFVEVAERSGNKKAVSRACGDLGAVFNSLSRYEDAAMYFTKAYDIARSMNNKDAISSSRVQYGIAMAHKMLINVSNHVNLANRPCLERIIDWKNNRNSSFEKDIPAFDSEHKTPENKQTNDTKEEVNTSKDESNQNSTETSNEEEINVSADQKNDKTEEVSTDS